MGAAQAGPEQRRRRRYRGVDPEARDARRRAQLLAAARELFGGQGYHSTTIAALCREAQVTTRDFYLLFEGREELFLGLYDSITREVEGVVSSAIAGAEADPSAQTLAGITAALEWYAADPAASRVVMIEIHGLGAAGAAHRQRAMERMFDLATAVLEEAQPGSSRDHRITAMALVGAVVELLVQRTQVGGGPPVTAVAQELLRLFAAALDG